MRMRYLRQAVAAILRQLAQKLEGAQKQTTSGSRWSALPHPIRYQALGEDVPPETSERALPA